LTVAERRKEGMGHYYSVARDAWKGMNEVDEVYREYAAKHKEGLM
jgi:hypothetical protein